MPHFKCVACKTRLYRGASPSEPAGDLCPGCGCRVEAVGALAEVVGFRSIAPRDGAAAGGASGTYERVGDLTARRELIRARARHDAHDAERWIDDGGGFAAEAVALPRPETNL